MYPYIYYNVCMQVIILAVPWCTQLGPSPPGPGVGCPTMGPSPRPRCGVPRRAVTLRHVTSAPATKPFMSAATLPQSSPRPPAWTLNAPCWVALYLPVGTDGSFSAKFATTDERTRVRRWFWIPPEWTVTSFIYDNHQQRPQIACVINSKYFF